MPAAKATRKAAGTYGRKMSSMRFVKTTCSTTSFHCGVKLVGDGGLGAHRIVRQMGRGEVEEGDHFDLLWGRELGGW